MHSTQALARALDGFRKKIDTIQRDIRAQKLEEHKRREDDLTLLQVESFRQFAPAPDLASFFHNLKQVVSLESNRYSTPAPLITQSPAADNTPSTPQVGPSTPNLPPNGPQSAPLIPPSTPSLFMQNLFRDAQTVWENALSGTTPHERYGQLFNLELADLTGDSPLLTSVGANAIPKLKNAQSAYNSERYGDALTILKVTLRNDPHNQTLAFLVSQFLYLLAGQGQQNAHPEARDLAQKSMILSDKIPPEKILWYRYHSISAEIIHSPERALEWLRDTDLTNPSHFAEKQGWMSSQGCHIKSLILLSRIPTELWGEREFDLLNTLVIQALGGSALYLHIFKPAFITQENRKEFTEKLTELEKSLAIAYEHYLNITNGFSKIAQYGNSYPWTVKNRFLLTLIHTSTVPSFDHILSNISLNAESWQTENYPDTEIRIALEDNTAAYWRWWAIALAPARDKIIQHPLSTAETLAEENLVEEANNLVNMLANEENSRKRADIWEIVQPWIVRWELDHLLAAGTGSSQPRQKFHPSLQPFNMYYRRWSEPVPSGPLGSDLILRNAKKGGFGNWYEVLAAFEGAIRLIDDPNHGIVAMQKRALMLAKIQDPNRFAGLKVPGSPMDFSKFGAMIIPLGCVAGILVATQMARNAGQAIGIVLVMMGLAGMVFMAMMQKKR